jgi:hypothetical protein
MREQFSTFWPYEVEVLEVDDVTGEIIVADNFSLEDKLRTTLPPLYGGSDGSGLFMKPSAGDRLLCVRVKNGRDSMTLPIRLLSIKNKYKSSSSLVNSGDIPPGYRNYPISNLKSGDVALTSRSGADLYLTGTANSSDIFLGNSAKHGIHVNKTSADTTSTILSRYIQVLSSASKTFSGTVVRTEPGTDQLSAKSVINNEIVAYDKNSDGKKLAFYTGADPSPFKNNGILRNPELSHTRTVINEFSEIYNWKGFDKEYDLTDSTGTVELKTTRELRSVNPRNSLYLGPFQLIEVLAGNIVTSRGSVLDINYSIVKPGDSTGKHKKKVPEIDYEEDRLISRRGLGYHFQLSTNSKSNTIPTTDKNFIFSLDKEGVLKVNVPKSSNTGNVPYPTSAVLYTDSGGVISRPISYGSDIPENIKNGSEKVPVLLKDSDGNVILPNPNLLINRVFSGSNREQAEEALTRPVGIRFSDDSSYFANLGTNQVDGNTLRVQFTKHHNMYAAAEAIIANRIEKINVPFTNAPTEFISSGNITGKAFELISKTLKPSGEDPNDIKYMSTVSVSPGLPAIETGGKTVVAGTSSIQNTDSLGRPTSVPFSNDFKVSGSGSDLTTGNFNKNGEKRLDPGGKSASVNLEGSAEISVGKDNYDQKSIVLDTAGSIISWLGKDRNGRSLVVQTDGEVLLNVGGYSGNSFNTGRFDLRVNVTDKGFLGETGDQGTESGHASDYIISISENGLVIAGMNPGAPMIIRNDGNLCLESSAKLILSGNSVVIRDRSMPESFTHTTPTGNDTPGADKINGPSKIANIAEAVSKK